MATIIPNILSLETLQIVSNNIELLSAAEREEGLQNEDMVGGAWSWYGLYITDSILMHIQSKVQQAINKKIEPTNKMVPNTVFNLLTSMIGVFFELDFSLDFFLLDEDLEELFLVFLVYLQSLCLLLYRQE